MLAPIGTQVQQRCSVVHGFSAQWFITFPSGLIITSLQPDALENQGIMVAPTSTSQESVLTVDGAEEVNGTIIQCQGVSTTSSMICQSEDIQLTFYGNT